VRVQCDSCGERYASGGEGIVPIAVL